AVAHDRALAPGRAGGRAAVAAEAGFAIEALVKRVGAGRLATAHVGAMGMVDAEVVPQLVADQRDVVGSGGAIEAEHLRGTVVPDDLVAGLLHGALGGAVAAAGQQPGDAG